jgi:hypothetical protein
MKIQVDEQFFNICEKILSENKTQQEWAFIESSDMFQTRNYCGGYDATEDAFCFSYYDPDGQEFWFQLSLNEVKEIVDRQLKEINSFKSS